MELTLNIMKELKTPFEIIDFFGGDESIIDWFYEDALKEAEKRNCTFSREVFFTAISMVANP